MLEHQFTNRLINETSPYLLQHAHNPVEWYPWGPEALERARNEDKPILLSIGYSACHWCHVMAHESFEDEQTARIMNENFICIKVDREERPDLDSIYMNVAQMLTGHGGWPMTAFLTPSLKPFYVGTYFPPEDRHRLPAFARVLLTMAEHYRTRRDEVTSSADNITSELRRLNQFVAKESMLTTETLNQAFSVLSSNFDARSGGFGGAPKFPPSMTLMFLLRHHKRTNSQAALEMVEVTLGKMASGGIYDQLGGGFHRYSVDELWLIPHFEKMLYDNALLTRAYLYAYQATKRPFYKRIAEETLEYIVRDMTDRSGGFYSAEDADSEGEEGKFYAWSRQEVIEELGEEGELFCDYFDVTPTGNFEHGKSVLNIPKSLEEFAVDRGLSVDQLSRSIASSRKKLYYRREERIRPGKDDKILTAWNAMMLTAFAEAANILGRDDYRQVAVRNADFILENLMRDGRLLRTFKNGQAKLNAYLEDYAYLIEGLLAVYEASFDIRYFESARRLADTMIAQFWDEDHSGFFYTSADHEELIARTKDYFDNATPSGNSVAALALLKLWHLTQNLTYHRSAAAILRTAREPMSRFASAFGYMLSALDFYLSQPKEIALVGNPDSHEIRLFIEQIYARYLPDKVIALAAPDDESRSIELTKGRPAVDNKPTAYVCREYTCLAPATTPQELAERLAE
jgi:uncharacterized protein